MKKKSSSVKRKNLKNSIEYRIGNDSIDINIAGVAWNPAAISLNCFKKQDLVDVNDVIQKKNGVESFEDIIRETFYKPKNKLFYWLFNVENDKLDIQEYENLDAIENNEKIMVNIKKIFFLHFESCF